MSDRLEQQIGVLGARITEVRGTVQVLQELRAEDRANAKTLAANVDIIRESVLDIQAKVSNLPCDRNTRRISGLQRSLDAAEDTGQISLREIEIERARRDAAEKERARIAADAERRWKRIATVVGIASGLAGLGLFKLLALAGCC